MFEDNNFSGKTLSYNCLTKKMFDRPFQLQIDFLEDQTVLNAAKSAIDNFQN